MIECARMLITPTAAANQAAKTAADRLHHGLEEVVVKSSFVIVTIADALRAFFENVNEETLQWEYSGNEQGRDYVTAKYSAEIYFVHEVHHASVSSNGALLLWKTYKAPWNPICEHHAKLAARARPYQPRVAKDEARRRRR